MAYTSRNAAGSGSGGGLFFGTQTLDNDSPSLLGYYLVAPLITVLSSLTEDVNIQYVSNNCGSFKLRDYQAKVKSQNKLFYVFNMIPTHHGATSTGNGWSTLTVFREDGKFEVFALTWTDAFSYEFAAAQTAFELDTYGNAVASGATTMSLYISGTYPTPAPKTMCYSDSAAALRASFVCCAQLHATPSPLLRSSLLQAYVLSRSA